jgi:D-glycero-D-manno-heptose 1,7-bisphosphate phosphatase
MAGAPCVFFDRDGIVNLVPEGVYYVSREEDFHLAPPFWEALAVAHAKGYRAVIATNQKGVYTGATPLAVLNAIHAGLRREAAARGLPIDAVYVCPHGETCACRKPKPGLLLAAARDLNLDLARSWMIGDKPRDCEAGRAAGCATVLVSAAERSEAADHRLDRLEDLPAFLRERLPPVTGS